MRGLLRGVYDTPDKTYGEHDPSIERDKWYHFMDVQHVDVHYDVDYQ